MTRLYKRIARLTLARPQTGEYFKMKPNALVIEDLRIAFSVEKSLDETPNTASITVANLSERSRSEFQTKPLHVRLEAGYDGDPARLFAGDISFCQHRRDGTEWTTTLESGDGLRAFSGARVSRTFKSGVDYKTVLGEVAGSMGLKIPKTASEAKELAAQFVSGVTISGPSSKEMSRILKPTGLNWSIQDGRLQMLRRSGVRRDRAIVVSPDTGLVGSPDFGAPTESGKQPVLSFKMLLYPGLTPGGRVRVSSRTVSGLFRIQRVTHTGDTEGPAWHSEVEATAV